MHIVLWFWLAVLSPFSTGNDTMPQHWWLITQMASSHYGVDPYFAGGVMCIESRFEGGPLGRGTFLGPGGLHRMFVKSFKRRFGVDIRIPEVNVWMTVRALQTFGREKTERDVLRRYNAECNSAYVKEVFQAKKQAKRRAKKWKNTILATLQSVCETEDLPHFIRF